ncbi:MAG: M24 family metallopeptidase C-terminal domain-containing protein [Alphaproteobacteria bacterium]
MDDVAYEAKARRQLAAWRARMEKPAGRMGAAARKLQVRINRLIPEQIHAVITGAIEAMTRAMLIGADFTTPPPLTGLSLQEREKLAEQKIMGWRLAATAEGGVFGDMLEFETLTLCPIDARCIDRSLLREDEVGWLNAYHATVRERLAPLVAGDALAWLRLRTEPIL